MNKLLISFFIERCIFENKRMGEIVPFEITNQTNRNVTFEINGSQFTISYLKSHITYATEGQILKYFKNNTTTPEKYATLGEQHKIYFFEPEI